MSKGGQTDTSTSQENATTTYPQWTQQAQQDMAGAAFNVFSPHIYTPQNMNAAQNPDQMRAFDMMRQNAVQTQRADRPSVMQQSGSYDPRMVEAAQLRPEEINQHMNPYLDSVGKSTIGNMRREYQNTDAMMAGRAAAASPFGGSAGAIARGQAARGYNENVGSAINNLMGQGFDQARATAMANTQMRQDAEMANARAANRASEFNQDFGLQQAGTESDLMDAEQRRRIAASGSLLQAGNQQQDFAQRVTETPLRSLEMLRGYLPNNMFNQTRTGNTTSTAPSKRPSTAQQILGFGASLLGNLSDENKKTLSDEDKKTNIEPVGTDPETGLPMYAYDYKADVERASMEGAPMPPKRVGPMAQDIEEEAPGLVRDLDGPDGSMIVSDAAMPGNVAMEGEIMEPGQPAPGPMPGMTDNGDGTVTMPVGLLSSLMASLEGETMMAGMDPGMEPGSPSEARREPREPGERRYAPPALLNL